MTHVYFVEHGEYSDHDVDGVFSTQEKAEEFARRLNLKYPFVSTSSYEKYTVSEQDLDPETPEPILRYYVIVHGSGDNPQYTPSKEPTYKEYWSVSVYKNFRNEWWGSISGATPEQALKNAYDAVAKAKAEMNNL